MKRVWLITGIAVVCIAALATFFRFHDLANYPAGLFPDEAANGEDVLLIFQGDTRPFYPRGNGREALFFYIQAAFVKAVGVGVWPMHAASATVGIATVIALYFATRVYFGRLAGLLASLFLATSSWHIALSRTGFRAIQVPLFVLLFTAFVGYTISAVKKKQLKLSYLYAVLGGISFAGGFYTYIAYRAMVGVILAILILLLLAALHPKIGFPHFRRYGYQLIVGIIAALITLTPLTLYFVYHPDEVVGRAGQVSIFNPDLQRELGGGTLLGTLSYTTSTTLLSFFVHGDENWRHNVAGYPLLNPLVGLLSLLGLLWTLKGTYEVTRQITKGKEVHMGMIYPYVLLLLFAMMLPAITTAEGMPHALRSIGMIAPIYLLAGVAGAVAIRWTLSWGKQHNLIGVVTGLITGLLLVFSAYGPLLYFMISRNSPEAYISYRGDLTVVSQYLNDYRAAHPKATRPYLVLDPFFAQTVHYLASASAHEYGSHPDEEQHTYTLLDPASSDLTFLKPGEVIVFTQSTIPDADRYESAHRDSAVKVESKMNRFGQEVMRVYMGKTDGAPKQEFDLDA